MREEKTYKGTLRTTLRIGIRKYSTKERERTESSKKRKPKDVKTISPDLIHPRYGKGSSLFRDLFRKGDISTGYNSPSVYSVTNKK